MRRSSLFLLALSLPLAALAQSYSNAPMVIIGDGAAKPAPAAAAPAPSPVPGKGFPNFPENAITRVGEDTTGSHVDAPANPPTPASPASPAAAGAPANPASPASPASPVVSKLWPRNTIEIFMPPCTGLKPQFVAPCTCTITRLMAAMPHDEFLRLSDAGTLEQDPRLIRIRLDCATRPQQKQD